MQKVKIGISGMSCKHCVMRVSKALKAIDGVVDADVSLEDKAAEVTFDESKTDKKALAEAVAEAGYSVV